MGFAIFLPMWNASTNETGFLIPIFQDCKENSVIKEYYMVQCWYCLSPWAPISHDSSQSAALNIAVFAFTTRIKDYDSLQNLHD